MQYCLNLCSWTQKSTNNNPIDVQKNTVDAAIFWIFQIQQNSADQLDPFSKDDTIFSSEYKKKAENLINNFFASRGSNERMKMTCVGSGAPEFFIILKITQNIFSIIGN